VAIGPSTLEGLVSSNRSRQREGATALALGCRVETRKLMMSGERHCVHTSSPAATGTPVFALSTRP